MEDSTGANEEHERFEIIFTEGVVDFITKNVFSKRVFKKIDLYCELLADFPELGAPYDPEYPAARPPFSCRRIPVPDTPFNLYYIKDDENGQITVFYIEHQGIDPESHFEWGVLSF